MKDYILENRDLIGQREMLQLSIQTTNNSVEISKLNTDIISIEKQISDVVEGLKDVVTKSELADMISNFAVKGGENDTYIRMHNWLFGIWNIYSAICFEE